MKDTATAFTYDLDDLDRAGWMDRVERIAGEFGQIEPVGPYHNALLIDAGRTLLVTFETAPRVRTEQVDNAPLGWSFVQTHGWSSLTVLANAHTDWFRGPALYGYFDRLIDDGFFDAFDSVLFFGAGAAGYAAAAYSIAAPEARVLVVQPQATLDPARTAWDRRHPEARRLDFTSRFGYAPAMLETAQNVWVVHDPSVIEDAMHATLFDGPDTTHLHCDYIGPDAQCALAQMDILPGLISQAARGRLSEATFATLWRARRTHTPYLHTLMHRLAAEGRHDRLIARMCAQLGAQGQHPLFAKKLADLQARGIAP